MFYLKLAFNNLKKSMAQTAPFLIVSVTMFSFSNIILLILFSPVIKTMGTGAIALNLAYIILLIFSCIMCLYSYNFLLRQRHREFGLYNILGMNKRQISLVSTIELVTVFLLTLALGSIISSIFTRVFYLIFINLVHNSTLHFEVNIWSSFANIIVFFGIFVFLEIINLIKIKRTSALDLFKNQEKGEKEPRGNIILALLGVVGIGFGYYLSLSAPASAYLGIIRFFQAIIVVILGTYLFFVSFIAWYLKKCRQNKGYYYQPKHFITVSQLLFRMKQNAVGLANITMLACMAFVTIFSTTALYLSSNRMIESSYPQNTVFRIFNPQHIDQAMADDIIESSVITPLKEDNPQFSKSLKGFNEISFTLSKDKEKKSIWVDKAYLQSENTLEKFKNGVYVRMLTQDEFRNIGNDLPQLQENQVAFYNFSKEEPFEMKELHFFDKTYQNVKTLESVKNIGNDMVGVDTVLVIVPDMTTLENFADEFNSLSIYRSGFTYQLFVNLSSHEQDIISSKAPNHVDLYTGDQEIALTYDTKSEAEQESFQFAGGFLFTGFLLGIVFLLGASLIIYYKQLTEGHQDKDSYRILQEVGMSFPQVKRVINSQILLVFFMPLLVAVLHFTFAIPLLKKLLRLFGVYGDKFLYTISSVTVVGILMIYFIIYKLTSRTYYKLVER